MMRLRRVPILAEVCACIVFSAVLPKESVAQYSNKVTTTPILIQDGFGPAGNQLPDDGLNYCFPTSFAMGLEYLGVNGFNQLAAAAPTQADGLNLVEVLAGLMGTDPINGTTTNPGAAAGLETYLAAKGINPATAVTFPQGPTISTLASVDQPGTAVMLGFGFINSSGNAVGGHAVTLLSQGVNAQGQSSPSTIVINNPEPSAFAPAADVPGSSLQYLNTISTSGAVASQGAIELDPNQYPGQLNTAAVVQAATVIQLSSSELSSSNPTPATWNLTGTQVLNLQGGSLSVIALLAGSGGITHGYGGTLEFEAANNTTGANTFVSGITQSDIALGLPFGTGPISLRAARLQLTPVNAGAATNLTLASGAGNQLTWLDGAVLGLDRNGNASLAVTIGGNTDGTTPNLSRTDGYGTLTIVPASGLANLGSLESVLVAGSSGNLPAVAHGIVAPYIVGQDNDAGSSGSFLTYGSSGFVEASYVLASATAIASAGTAAVFDANVAQALSTTGTAQVYALRLDGVAITGGTASDLKVGNQTSGEAGIIFNGGTISTKYLDFGGNQGVIYGNLSGGTIAAVIRSGSVDVFGPGSITLTASNSYTGGTYVSSGMLVAANAAGTATGSGAVDVRENATLMISGSSAKAGSSAGVSIEGGGVLWLNGGTVAGPLTVNGGTMLGFGTISGSATVNGYIGSPATSGSVMPGGNPSYTGVENLTFAGNYTLLSGSTTYSWRLNALDDAPSDAGVNWSLLTYTTKTGSAYFGTPTSPINVCLDLAANVPDPNSGNAFWNEPHQWLIATEPYSFTWYHPNFGTPGYRQGSFSIASKSSNTDVYIDYAPDQWQTNSPSANWFGTQNWTTVIPNGPGVAANLWSLGGGTIDLGDSSPDVSNLNFNSTGSAYPPYQIIATGSGALNLTGSGGAPATIEDMFGKQSISAPVILNTAVNVSVTRSIDTLKIGGPISGIGGLVSSGSGRVFLSGSNSYSGGTTVANGTLEALSPASLPGFTTPGTVTVTGGVLAVEYSGGSGDWQSGDISTLLASDSGAFASGSALGIDTAGGNVTYGGTIAGAMGLTKLGGGSLAVSASNTYSGATEVSGGTLAISKIASGGQPSSIGASSNATSNLVLAGGLLDYSGGAASINRGFEVISGGTIQVDQPGAVLTFSGTVSSDDSGTLTKTGPGGLVFAGRWNLGTLRINDGDLQLYNFDLDHNDVQVAAGATLTAEGGFTLNAESPTSSSTATLVSGAGTVRLRKSGSSLSNPDIQYASSSGTNLQATIAANLDLGNSPRYIVGYSNQNSFENDGGDLVLSGAISGTNSLTFSGTPNNVFQMSFVLSGKNTSFTGPVTMHSGVLVTANSAALSAANAMQFSPTSEEFAGLYLYGTSMSIGSLSGTSAGTMSIRNGSSSFGGDNAIPSPARLTVNQTSNGTFNGSISGGPDEDGNSTTAYSYYSLGLTKAGNATLVLGGSNSYSGGTTVSDGELLADSAASLPFGGSLTIGTASGAAGQADTGRAPSAQATAVPEPGSLVLLAAGSVVAFAAWRWKR